MWLQNRSFIVYKNVIFLGAFFGGLFVFLLIAAPVFAKNDKVYTVAKFFVEAKAKNAVKAKRKAIAKGQQDAFNYLLRRIINYRDYNRLPPVDKRTIASLLNGLSVRNERNSQVRYIARLDFNFQADRVRKLLRSYSIPFIEEQSKKIVLVPVYFSDANEKQIRKNQKQWRKSWTSLDLTNTLTPIQVGHLKPSMTVDVMRDILAGKRDVYDEMTSRYFSTYKTKNIIFAYAYPSQVGSKLSVTLIGVDAAGPFRLHRDYSRLGRTLKIPTRNAANFSLRVIEGRWKVIRSDNIGEDGLASVPQKVIVTVIYSGFKQWQVIRKKIETVPGVDSIEVDTFSARGAEISLSFPGGGERLAKTLSRHNLNLQNENGAWVLRGS